MDRSTFAKFREIVYEKSGIFLRDGKESLVAARVGKRMRALNIGDHKTYIHRIVNDDTGEEIVHLLDAISTNVTSFFREANHFDFLGQTIANWLEQGQTRFRFWSAACSTGEEPYSMAMTVLEAARLANVRADLKLLATDLSTRVLQQCRTGIYEAEKVKDVPPPLRPRYLQKLRENGTVEYAAKDELKRLVVFKRLNLSKTPFPMSGPFDAIFCRNVMIYFDNTVRRNLLKDMYRLLRPGGYLMVGHAESLTGMVSDFKVVKPSIYIKN